MQASNHNFLLQHYADRRVARLFLLGLASGFPWVLIGSALTIWLEESGLSRTNIGYAGAIFAAYSINFLWAPLVDRFRPPLLSRFGARKSWIMFCLIMMSVSALLISLSDPTENARLTVLLCLLVAVFSATQDIAIDAYRIDSIPDDSRHLIGPAAAIATAGWWTGFSGFGALALYASDWPDVSWQNIYFAGAAIMVGLLLPIAFFEERGSEQRKKSRANELQKLYTKIQSTSTQNKVFAVALLALPALILLWLIAGTPGAGKSVVGSLYFVPSLFIISIAAIASSMVTVNRSQLKPSQLTTPSTLDRTCVYILDVVAVPFASFIRKNGLSLALKILLFIFLFKIGEAFLGRMSIVFYKELGFSNTDIGNYSKLLNWAITVIVSLVGGLFTVKFGLVRGLFFAGIAMASSNVMFSLLAIYGPVYWLFASTVIIDSITSAWSQVAFVAFLSFLCQRNFSASQYALFASIGTLGRTLLGSSSGVVVDRLDGNWAVFFVLTAIAVIPSLILLARIASQVETVNNR